LGLVLLGLLLFNAVPSARAAGHGTPARTLQKTVPTTPPTTTTTLPSSTTVGTATTTVLVGLFDTAGPPHFVLSQSTLPSGTVTFVITNSCQAGCSFDLEGVKAGAILTLPGQSETWTVTLAPGTYRYHCDVDPDMKGSLTVTS